MLNIKICTLNQALECINGQCQINIELKSAAQGAQLLDQIQRLSHLLAQAKTQQLITYQQLIISSFNHHALLLVAEHLPEITTAALIACCPITYAEFCKKLNVKMLNLSIECLNPEIVNDAHLRGLQVWVYTVDKCRSNKAMSCLPSGWHIYQLSTANTRNKFRH